MDKELETTIIEFLKTQKRNLKQNDLNTVYDNIVHFGKPMSQSNVTEFLREHGIEPLDYFKKEIPHYAYYHQSSYTGDLKIPDGIEKIGSHAFDKTEITSLYIPSSVKEIGICAFCDTNLEKIYIDGCPKFREDAFIWNPNVKQFNMNCSKDQFNRINPNQLEEYSYDCGIDIQFLK